MAEAHDSSDDDEAGGHHVTEAEQVLYPALGCAAVLRFMLLSSAVVTLHWVCENSGGHPSTGFVVLQWILCRPESLISQACSVPMWAEAACLFL